MKKKTILVAAIAVMLVAALVVGGTLAYFTDKDNATNTFTVGNVKIDLLESACIARMPVTSALRVRSSIPKMLSCGPKFLSWVPAIPTSIKLAIPSIRMRRSKLTLPRIRVTVSSLLRDSLTTRCPMSRTLVPTMLISASA